ncbi:MULTISPECIES: GntR family transcriptional regulator [unclassified Sinorhizobium]|uniref:GntR family transcriptional regulator n=1 Tax=unclassified Sinorhizobium TaxID=2613772 RepID=UPI003524ECEF
MDADVLMERIGRELSASASSLPLYKRLKTAIEEAIRSNALKAGAILPGERVIAETLALSRVTVRKALALLEEEGLLNRRHGFKTEVGSRVEKSLSTLTSFSEDIRARGLVPGCLWLSKHISRPSPAEMMALGIAGNANVVRMKRVRTADGVPIAVETSAVPVRFLPSPELVRDSLYEALDARGFIPQRAIQRMRSRAASTEDAKYLHCEAGAPLLMTERRCFLGDGQIVEYCETRYKGDVYDFVFELQR